MLTRKNLPKSAGQIANPASSKEKKQALTAALFFVALVIALSSTGLITPDNIDAWVISLTGVSAVALFVILFRSNHTDETEHSRVKSFVPMWFANVIFWALFQQQFTVMAVYSDTRIDWNILGMQLKPGVFNSINPMFIIIFGVLFSVMWTKLGERQPTVVTKFALGLLGAGIAFAIFLFPAGHHTVNVAWLVLVLFVITMAELVLSPTGTSLTTKLSPEAHKSQMMAFYWTSVAMGTALAGWLAQFYREETEGTYFLVMAAVSAAAGVLVFLGRKPILKLMQGVR